jgi:hypothetical protein
MIGGADATLNLRGPEMLLHKDIKFLERLRLAQHSSECLRLTPEQNLIVLLQNPSKGRFISAPIRFR